LKGDDQRNTHIHLKLTQDAFATGTSKALGELQVLLLCCCCLCKYNNFAPFNPAVTDINARSSNILKVSTDGREQPIQVIKQCLIQQHDSLIYSKLCRLRYWITIELVIEGVVIMEQLWNLNRMRKKKPLMAPNYMSIHPTYKPNLGPMDMIVVNPDSIKPGNYEVWFKVDSSYSKTEGGEYSLKQFQRKATWSVRRINGSQVDTVYKR
jgi:hypothetical protein